MKLLIVDDSMFIREAIKKKLREYKVEFYEAGDGDAAVKLYEKERPDLVFMDIMMKKEDSGIVAIQEIKKINPQARIVVVSSIGDNEELIRHLMGLGVLDIITKPFNQDQLAKYFTP